MVAIASGKVWMVATEHDFKGHSLYVAHYTGEGGIRLFHYAHVTNIVVTKGERVVAGKRLATVWKPADWRRKWQPHVHLEIIGEDAPIEKLDPLSLIQGCSCRGSVDWVYPVSCEAG